MTRRMTLIVLALVGLMVFVVTISPPERNPTRGSTASITPTPSASAKLTDPYAFDVSAKLSTAPGAANEPVDAEVGDRVEITVEGTDPDSVSLGDLAIEDVDADSPARFELLADTPGTYPIVVLSDNRRIGSLEIH